MRRTGHTRNEYPDSSVHAARGPQDGGMDASSPAPARPTEWIFGTEDEMVDYLVANTDSTDRDRVVLAAINVAAIAAGSDADRLGRIRQLTAARSRAREAHHDDQAS
jgi:hypothetical protein